MYKNFYFYKYKNKILAISLIAIFAISLAMGFGPTVSAQAGITQPRETTGYVDVAPHLIGVGQQATVNLWVAPWAEDYGMVAWYDPATNGGGYTGISVTFTKPDGTKDTFTPTDAIGVYPAGVTDGLSSLYFYYTPNMAGNWSVTMSMPAQNFTDWSGTVQWKACTSQPAYFTVTAEQQNAGLLNGWPYSPLPNDNTYWSYPINSNNREWASLAGNWLYSGLFTAGSVNTAGYYQPYGPAPNTGHILWDIPYAPGGIVNGATGSLSYQPTFNIKGGSLIITGKLYINSADATNFECVDLTTGKILWTVAGQIAGAMDLPGNAYTQANAFRPGVVLAGSYGSQLLPYLFQNSGKTWNYYNAQDGALMVSITNVSATSFYFVEASVLAFGYTTATPSYMWKWNLTKVVNNDWYTGLMWRTKFIGPTTNSSGVTSPGSGGSSFAVSADLSTMVFANCRGGNLASGFGTADGHSVWNDTFTYVNALAQPIALPGTNDFYTFDETSCMLRVYSDITGALLWETKVGTTPWNSKSWGIYSTDLTNVYFVSPDGTIVALDLATGKVVWQSTPISSIESPTNVVDYWYPAIIAGGNLYVYGADSAYYQQNPVSRFGMLVCINATTGAVAWTLNGGVFPVAEAGGYLTGVSSYDGNYYCLGKGQTLTSVSVQNNVVTEGSTALITGNVLDQSPAQQGTPAVSDSSMSEWMDYLHMQNATLLNTPPKELGVTVTLTTVDPNNNTVVIGTTTTDSAGNYYYNYVPSTTGIYKITANFAGSGSYWPSTSETGLTVTSAAASSTSAPATTTSSGISTTDFYTLGAAIIVAIIIVGVALFLLLRKRP